MKFRHLRIMQEWRMEIDHDWSVRPGDYARGLKKHLVPERWAELEKTYVGAKLEDNWQALFATIELFKRVATEVGDHRGYDYPHDLHARVVLYLQRIKSLDRESKVRGDS